MLGALSYKKLEWRLFAGEVINEKDRCKKCEGKKVIKEVKILEVHVDKGMKHGQRITFTGEADQAPGVEPGDIVLLLQEKEHEVISFWFIHFFSPFYFTQNWSYLWEIDLLDALKLKLNTNEVKGVKLIFSS